MIFPAKPKHSSCHKTIKMSDKRHTRGRIKKFLEFSIIEITVFPTKASGVKLTEVDCVHYLWRKKNRFRNTGLLQLVM
jgi:hypothetical protein